MEGLIALVYLHLERFLKQITFFEMINDEIEEVDMHHSQAGPVFGDVGHEEPDMITDAEFCFRRVVEDIEGDLVPKPFAAEELDGSDLWKDLI